VDHVEIVLDHKQAAAVVDQALERGQELRDIVEVQAAWWLVENVERPLARRLPRCAASLTRWASPPESVVADCPSRK
jgi:hypothetical protein